MKKERRSTERAKLFFESFIGKTFGRWTVEKIYRDPKRPQHNWRAAVKCGCGTTKEMAICNLRNGRSKGCRRCYLARVKG